MYSNSLPWHLADGAEYSYFLGSHADSSNVTTLDALANNVIQATHIPSAVRIIQSSPDQRFRPIEPSNMSLCSTLSPHPEQS
mmetsp:Transcript_9779/g.20755  ORF Transcript_9779/g.20755 Transcript_9779/m.20755 type:complete len:82 (+) Transcript_9779:1133-1378(+)